MSVKKILLCAAEAMPFAATGGLGDVMGSLPAALYQATKEKADVRVVLPYYDVIDEKWRNQMKLEAEFEVPENCGYFRITVVDEKGRHACTNAYFVKDLMN